MTDKTTIGSELARLCEELKANVPGLEACEPLANQLSPDVLGRSSARLPAAFLAPASIDTDNRVGCVSMKIKWAAFLVVSDRMDAADAANLLDALVMAGDAGNNVFLGADNLYKGDAGKVPVAVFIVRFETRIWR